MKKFVRDKESHRASIIQTTEKLIGDIGYESTSIRQISEQAQVSIGLIYKNFPAGKSEIVAEIFRNQVKEILKPNEVSRLSYENFPQFIAHTLEKLIRVHRKNQKINHALEVAYNENPDLQDEFRTLISQELDGLIQIFRMLNASKSLSLPEDPNWVLLLIHMLDSIIHRHIGFDLMKVTDEKLISYLMDFILRVIGVK